MDGARLDLGAGFLLLALGIGLLGGVSTLAVDFCKRHSAQFLTLHLTLVMLVVAVFAVVVNGHVTLAIHSMGVPKDFFSLWLGRIDGNALSVVQGQSGESCWRQCGLSDCLADHHFRLHA